MESIKKKLAIEGQEEALTQQENRIYYGAYNVYEFVEMMMTQPEFQKEMAKIKTDSGKSVLDLFKNFINTLFKNLGVKFETGTVASEAIENILILVDEKGRLKQQTPEVKSTKTTQPSTVITDAKAEIERIVDAFEPETNFKSPVDAWNIVIYNSEGELIKPEINVEIKGNDYNKEELLEIEDPENPAIQETLNEIDRLQKLLDAKLAALESSKPSTTSEKPFTTKIDQFTYTYNPVTKQVIHNAKSGDKVETNETQINKVLAAYAKANNFETKVFNKQEYLQINGKVLNVNTGSKVIQKEIVDLFTPTVSNPVKNDLLNILEEIQKDIDEDNDNLDFPVVNAGEFSGYPNIQKYLISEFGIEQREYQYFKANKYVV